MSYIAKTAYEVRCNGCDKLLVYMSQTRFWSKNFADDCARARGWTIDDRGKHWCGCPKSGEANAKAARK